MVWLVWYIHSISMLMGYQISSAMYIRSMNFIKTASEKSDWISLYIFIQLVLPATTHYNMDKYDNGKGNVSKRVLQNYNDKIRVDT